MRGLGEEEQSEKGPPRSGQIQPRSSPASGSRAGVGGMACPTHSCPIHSQVRQFPGRHCNPRGGAGETTAPPELGVGVLGAKGQSIPSQASRLLVLAQGSRLSKPPCGLHIPQAPSFQLPSSVLWWDVVRPGVRMLPWHRSSAVCILRSR